MNFERNISIYHPQQFRQLLVVVRKIIKELEEDYMYLTYSDQLFLIHLRTLEKEIKEDLNAINRI